LDGTSFGRDQSAALRWFHRAAAAGLPDAMNMVGRCHELGWGVPADPATAATWYRRAALLGLEWAQFNLANLLLYGIGLPRDRRAALAWYRRAAARGHAKSMNLVGRFLEAGWEVQPDPRQAMMWYQAAAQGGDFRGQYNLATLLLSLGHVDEAERWFRAAIEGGSPDFRLVAGEALSGRCEPVLRRLGHTALACCGRHRSDSRSDAAIGVRPEADSPSPGRCGGLP
jgi:uncharacterized protein